MSTRDLLRSSLRGLSAGTSEDVTEDMVGNVLFSLCAGEVGGVHVWGEDQRMRLFWTQWDKDTEESMSERGVQV
jgi:hypothetical protein